MKGTRPLNNDEIRRVSAAFTGTYERRNRSLFMIGVSTGGRISELLSLRHRSKRSDQLKNPRRGIRGEVKRLWRFCKSSTWGGTQ